MSQSNPKGSAFYSGATRYGGSAANAKRREAARKAFFTFKEPQTSEGASRSSGAAASASRSSMFNVPDMVSTYTINSNNIIRKEPPIPQLTTQAKKIFSWIQENSYAQQETFQLTKRTNLKKHRFNPMAYRAPVYKQPTQSKRQQPIQPATTSSTSFTIPTPVPSIVETTAPITINTTSSSSTTSAPSSFIPRLQQSTVGTLKPKVNIKFSAPQNDAISSIKPPVPSVVPTLSLPNGFNTNIPASVATSPPVLKSAPVPTPTPIDPTGRFSQPKFCGSSKSVAPVFVLPKSFTSPRDLAVKAEGPKHIEPKKNEITSPPAAKTTTYTPPSQLTSPLQPSLNTTFNTETIFKMSPAKVPIIDNTTLTGSSVLVNKIDTKPQPASPQLSKPVVTSPDNSKVPPTLILSSLKKETTGIKPPATLMINSSTLSMPNGLSSITSTRFSSPRYCGPKESVAPVFVLPKSFAQPRDLTVKVDAPKQIESKKNELTPPPAASTTTTTTSVMPSPLPLFTSFTAASPSSPFNISSATVKEAPLGGILTLNAATPNKIATTITSETNNDQQCPAAKLSTPIVATNIESPAKVSFDDVEMDIDADHSTSTSISSAIITPVVSSFVTSTAPLASVTPLGAVPSLISAGTPTTQPLVTQTRPEVTSPTTPVASQPLFIPPPSFATPTFSPVIPTVPTMNSMSMPNGSNPFQPTSSTRGRKILRPARRLHR